MRLIDADALVKELHTKMNAHPVDSEMWLAYYNAAHTADTQPTAEAKVTLRGLLESAHGSTNCVVWLGDEMAKRHFPFICGVATSLLQQQGAPMLLGFKTCADGSAHIHSEDGDSDAELVVQLENR